MYIYIYIYLYICMYIYSAGPYWPARWYFVCVSLLFVVLGAGGVL